MEMKKIDGLIGSILLFSLALTGCGGSGGSNSQPTPNKTTPTLVSISVTGSTTTVVAGSTLQLSASGKYSDGSTGSLTTQVSWKTSDATLATISTSGLVTGVAAGTVTITATDGAISGTKAVVVGQATLSQISVSGISTSPTAGTSDQLTAQGTYSDNSTQTLTSEVTWESSNSAIATVSNTGLLTAVAAGTVTVTATMSGVSGTLGIVVAPVVLRTPILSTIVIAPLSFSVSSGQAKQLSAQGLFSDGSAQDLTTQVSWNSSATNTVSVNSTGLVSGVSAGTATITATFGSTSGNATVTVSAAVLNSIVVTPATPSIATGQTQAFAANGIFSDGSTTDITNAVTWTSTATKFATINATGLATGVSAGSANITATSGSVSGSMALTVTPAVLTEVDISPDAQTIPIGGQLPLSLTGTYSDNSTQTISNATWSSSDSTLASVDPVTGIVTGVGNSNGNAVTITATSGGMTDTTTVFVTAAVAESLTLTPATNSIASGTTMQYAVSATYSDGSTQAVTTGLSWASSSPTTAAVNAAGIATGISPGQSTITVTYGTVTGTASLTVTPATLTGLVVVPTSPTVGINGNVQFTATGIFTDNSTQDLTSQATWNSSAANVALISSAGMATGLSTGTTTVTASYEGMSGSSTLTVAVATLVSINITPANPVVPPHSTLQMTAIGVFSDGSTAQLTNVYWRSIGGYYGTISRTGLVRTRRASHQPIQITATLNGITGRTSLTVSTMTVATLKLVPATATMAVGTTLPFQLIGTFSDGVTTVDLSHSVRWQTSNWEDATIDWFGVAYGRASGSVTITASFGNLAPATSALTVSNATVQSITVTPASPTIGRGAIQQFTATGLFSDGSTQDITTVSRWTSSDPWVGLVWFDGLGFSTGHGQTNIQATFEGVSGETLLTVN